MTLSEHQQSEPQQARQIPHSPHSWIQRRPVEHRHQGAGDPLERRLVVGERASVARRQRPDRLDRPRTVAVEHERLPVRVDVERRTGLIDAQTTIAQPHVSPDGPAQHRQHVGAG